MMTGLNEIYATQLIRLIGTPDCPPLIDVRSDEAFNSDPFLIPSAIRKPYANADKLIASVAEKGQAIIICKRGAKLSHGVPAILRSRGVNAYVVLGRNRASQDAGLLRVPANLILAVLWVTRYRPKIDRIACPWLIRRFVDSTASLLFVPPAEVAKVAEKFEANVFDVEGAFWSQRNKTCTLDTMITEFGLNDPTLETFANVVHAADTNSHELTPQAAGVLAFSVGFSRMYNDDKTQLNAGTTLCDAHYRWARDGQDEGHDWPIGHGQ